MKRVSLLFVSLLLVVGMVGCGAKEEGAASSAAVESGAVATAGETESPSVGASAGAEAQGKVDGAQEAATVASGEEVGKAVTDGTAAESKGETGAEAVAVQEPIVYEGIDMESTLPGKDWIKTFEGIIDVPKFVVFNDETNKKVIVENNGEVEFAEGDTLAIYSPAGYAIGAAEGENVDVVHYVCEDYSTIRMIEGKEIVTDTIKVKVYRGKERFDDMYITIKPVE